MATRASGAPSVRLLESLCNAVGVSGDESAIRKIIIDELGLESDAYRVDALGNLLVCRAPRRKGSLRVMLDAHMDEVGFMIVREDGDGLYEFQVIGGIDPRSLPGKQVVIGTKATPGVIGAKPIHHTTPEERKRALEIEALRIDVGPGGKLQVGDRGTFMPNFSRSGAALLSKALDNRLGVATLVELLRRPMAELEIQAAFTVQEEIGLRGAKVAAHHFEPDLAIILDSTPANDLPMQRDGDNTAYNTRLGGGPAIYLTDGATIHDRRLVDYFAAVAKKAKIPFQLRQPGGGGTDAGAIQRSLAGIPVLSISVPHRYTHTAMSIAWVDDWSATLSLVSTALRGLTPAVLKTSKRAA